ncbi:variant erythrocyte surface antigen-1, alpha subunit [Babesia divergens]|uniref:Variant erythrocyte surface antigen-1, alpha subunit n=1 Tax=Babesia divergens TaxID=32595 RepID=A0AAD9LIF8_BABDI|nr:variant erythrocyte surface antigen-1, alpha subunit [Babesia divergens]
MSIIIIAILASQSALGLYFLVLFLVYSFHCLSLHCKVRMFFIPSCFPGCRIIVSLSVPRTLRSVLTGSLGPLRGISRLVCCMYYTDVFVGTVNDIDKLKSALKAELNVSVLNALTQLVQGLCLFMGYPSCLCKPKKSVEESLKKISKELKEELKNYECLSKSNSDLNCSSCSDSVVCKCCVLDCITKVQKCKCVKGGSGHTCKCSKDDPKRCCKDLLEKLKASLSLLNLKADMEKLCSCTDDCCKNGVCTQKGSPGCKVCPTSKPSNATSDYTVTGLGLLRPSPKRLAEKLENFFGDSGRKGSCNCTCGTSGQSCCCLACPGNCLKSCTAKCGSQGCSSQHTPKDCPCKTFCSNINGLKVSSGSSLMRCCDSGNQCHCKLGSSKCSGDCCKERNKQSLKCMIRRLVSYFKSLEPLSSSPSIKNFKNCCELMCVLKTCEFLRSFYNDKRNLNECKECKKGTKGGKCSLRGKCCDGPNPNCGSSGQDPCKSCDECQQICNAKKFYRELQTLQYSGPCGQDLYRVLDDFLYYCCYVFYAKVKGIQTTLEGEHAKKCKQCTGGSCTCSPSSGCLGCAQVLEELKKLQAHKDVLSLMTRGYSSAYSSKASWTSLTSSGSGSKCCGSSSSCSSCLSCSPGSPCDPSKCCPDCPQRKAAKIFLGMLPCLYYGLKIIYDRCKYNSGFAGWHDIAMDSNGKPESALAKFFFAWGFQTIESSGSSTIHLDPSLQAMVLPVLLENLFTPESNGILKNLYEKSKKYFTSFSSHSLSSGSLSPSTVRSMLLWLYGLPYTSGFHDLVSRCKDLCSPFGNSFHPDAFCYYIHTCCSLLPVAIISSIETSESAQKVFTSAEWKTFSYPSDPSKLFEAFCEYVRKIFVALKFLCIQCRLDRDSAGWKYCAFGQSCKVEPLDSGSASGSSGSLSTSGSSSSSDCSCKYSGAYLCTGKPYGINDAHDHCIKAGQTCVGFSGSGCDGSNHQSGSKTCSNPCPHPLMRFLVDGSPSSKSEAYPFGLSGITPMGFKSDSLPSPGRRGHVLHDDIKVFCDDGFYPLTRLVQFELCISRRPPKTFLELYGFLLSLRIPMCSRIILLNGSMGSPDFILAPTLRLPWKTFSVPIPDPIPLTFTVFTAAMFPLPLPPAGNIFILSPTTPIIIIFLSTISLTHIFHGFVIRLRISRKNLKSSRENF